jgi:signal transduction histidine kinase
MIKTESASLIERYQRLIELSCDLASTLDLNTLLNRIVHSAADLCHGQAASILLYDEMNQQLYFHAATNLDTPLMRGLIVPVDSSIAGWMVLHRQPVIISDAQQDPRHFNQVAKVTQVMTKSLLGVPMITKDKVIGVLEVINKLSGVFTTEDQELLMALGAQAAVVIENTRLFNQSDLISELVHEIRTPLSSLSAVTYLLQRQDLKPEQSQDVIETMQGEIQRLDEMTTAFLDLARLESGRTQFKFEQVNLREILLECVVFMSCKVEDKQQILTVMIPEHLPNIFADFDKTKQVFLNLLSNAIKYSPNGGKISLETEILASDVLVKVEDNGVGIPPEKLGRIFDKFYRVPGSELTAPGTGLGLSICQRIIEAHKGRIEVVSKPGEGSTFMVYLPIYSAKGNASAQIRPGE